MSTLPRSSRRRENVEIQNKTVENTRRTGQERERARENFMIVLDLVQYDDFFFTLMLGEQKREREQRGGKTQSSCAQLQRQRWKKFVHNFTFASINKIENSSDCSCTIEK